MKRTEARMSVVGLQHARRIYPRFEECNWQRLDRTAPAIKRFVILGLLLPPITPYPNAILLNLPGLF
jgi:hypothetical protein